MQGTGKSNSNRIPPATPLRRFKRPKALPGVWEAWNSLRTENLFICTREGEVWKYSPENEKWSLFADGLHEALGIWIDPKSSETHAIQRPEIHQELIDTDKDGQADLYESFNAGWA